MSMPAVVDRLWFDITYIETGYSGVATTASLQSSDKFALIWKISDRSHQKQTHNGTLPWRFSKPRQIFPDSCTESMRSLPAIHSSLSAAQHSPMLPTGLLPRPGTGVSTSSLVSDRRRTSYPVRHLRAFHSTCSTTPVPCKLAETVE